MQISIRNLSKSYTNKPRFFKIRGLFDIHTPEFALKDINISIKSGECVGIIGQNGSGKSTLLKLLCGITAPTQGEISVNGKISALLELGTGFNPEYTGISNIYLNGTLQGLSKKETAALIPKIAEFAEIGDYIYKPVKTYSDGMFLRLAFSCAIMLKPDILIIDEALAVGDFYFRQKCFSKIEEMKNSGVTIIMVSHDIDTVRRLCTRTIWLDKGILKADDDTVTVSAAYMESITGNAETFFPVQNNSNIKTYTNRFGSATGSIVSLSMPSTMETGHTYEITINVDLPNGIELKTTALSISLKNSYGLDLTVVSTADYDFQFIKHGSCYVKLQVPCLLTAGEYSVCVSLEDRGVHPIKYYDYIDGLQTFCVFSEKDYFGTFNTPAKISVEYGVE